MKMNISKGIIALGLVLGFNTSAQVTTTLGGESANYQKKGANYLNFNAGGNHYFFTSTFEQAMMQFYLECFSASGQVLAQNKLEINVGVFNNSYSISDVVALGNNVYATVEHLDKAAGKNSLSARLISSKGNVATEETALLSMPFEKTMNSGINHAAVSPNQSVLAVVGEMPFVKEEPAKVKVALFDENLKETASHDVSLPGVLTKNRNIDVYVANDGTVYLLMRTTTKNGEIALQVFQINNDGSLKQYGIETTAPTYIISYTATTNASNELIVAGTTYERKTVTVGEKMVNGVFYFTNKGKAENSFTYSELDAPVENLTARKLLVNETTIFLSAEIFKEEKIVPPASAAGTAASYETNYNYTHKNEYVFGFDETGAKKFELNVAKEFTARDFNRQYLSGAFVINGKLTLVYNDASRKYEQTTSNNSIVPVIVTITNDGMMSSPIVMIDKLKLPYNFILYPSVSMLNGDTMLFLMKNNDKSQFVSMKLN